MAALSFSVHSATTLARISFMYNMKALSGFLMWGFFSSSFFTVTVGDFLQGADSSSGPADAPPEGHPVPSSPRPNSRVASGADTGLGGLLLDDGRDDGGVRDARGVQPVGGRWDHVRGEAAGHQTVAGEEGGEVLVGALTAPWLPPQTFLRTSERFQQAQPNWESGFTLDPTLACAGG